MDEEPALVRTPRFLYMKTISAVLSGGIIAGFCTTENFAMCILLSLSLIPLAVLVVAPARTRPIPNSPKSNLVSFNHDYDTGNDITALPPD